MINAYVPNTRVNNDFASDTLNELMLVQRSYPKTITEIKLRSDTHNCNTQYQPNCKEGILLSVNGYGDAKTVKHVHMYPRDVCDIYAIAYTPSWMDVAPWQLHRC